MLTIPNGLTPSLDEYAIVALLGNSSVRLLTDVQKQLYALIGDALWVAPARCLHITLMEIICDADYGDLSRRRLYSDWYNKYGKITKEIISTFPPFTLEFNELCVSPSAIIIKASNPEPLNRIRTAIQSKTALPKETKRPPNIAHCTIARFIKSIPIKDITKKANSLGVNTIENIESFKLVDGLAPPTLNPRVIANYPLEACAA